MTDAMYIILHTGCLYFDTRKKRSSAERFFCPALHSIIYYSLYFLLPAHAAALFSSRPLSGFPARFSVPQANPAFLIWSCGTLHICFYEPHSQQSLSRVLRPNILCQESENEQIWHGLFPAGQAVFHLYTRILPLAKFRSVPGSLLVFLPMLHQWTRRFHPAAIFSPDIPFFSAAPHRASG